MCITRVELLIYIYISRCGPHILAHALPLDGELDFYFGNNFYLLKRNDLESPLIFILFLKG